MQPGRLGFAVALSGRQLQRLRCLWGRWLESAASTEPLVQSARSKSWLARQTVVMLFEQLQQAGFVDVPADVDSTIR
eukprot:15264381-Alexandrium_andersonii.AAC.1